LIVDFKVDVHMFGLLICKFLVGLSVVSELDKCAEGLKPAFGPASLTCVLQTVLTFYLRLSHGSRFVKLLW